MAKRVLGRLFYGIIGGGTATCLGFMLYCENKPVSAARAIPIEKDDYKFLQAHDSYPAWDSDWDRREFYGTKENTSDVGSNASETVKEPMPTATRHIILIRHGQYNLKGAKDIDCYLTELGRKQATATGLRLKELCLPYSKLVHSTMTRAKETAGLILPSLPPDLTVKTSDLLREGAPIAPEPSVAHWRPEKKHFFTDGARIEAAFRKYFHRAKPSQKENSYEIIVCHANVIRYFICRAMQFPPEAWLRFNLHHCSLTWIAIRPTGRVVTYLIGDCGHLPKELMTSS